MIPEPQSIACYLIVVYTDIALLKEVRSSFDVEYIQIFEKVKREGWILGNFFCGDSVKMRGGVI